LHYLCRRVCGTRPSSSASPSTNGSVSRRRRHDAARHLAMGQRHEVPSHVRYLNGFYSSLLTSGTPSPSTRASHPSGSTVWDSLTRAAHAIFRRNLNNRGEWILRVWERFPPCEYNQQPAESRRNSARWSAQLDWRAKRCAHADMVHRQPVAPGCRYTTVARWKRRMRSNMQTPTMRIEAQLRTHDSLLRLPAEPRLVVSIPNVKALLLGSFQDTRNHKCPTLWTAAVQAMPPAATQSRRRRAVTHSATTNRTGDNAIGSYPGSSCAFHRRHQILCQSQSRLDCSCEWRGQGRFPADVRSEARERVGMAMTSKGILRGVLRCASAQ